MLHVNRQTVPVVCSCHHLDIQVLHVSDSNNVCCRCRYCHLLQAGLAAWRRQLLWRPRKQWALQAAVHHYCRHLLLHAFSCWQHGYWPDPANARVLEAVATLHWCTTRLRVCLRGWRTQAARLLAKRAAAAAAQQHERHSLLHKALVAWQRLLQEAQQRQQALWAAAQPLVAQQRLQAKRQLLAAWQQRCVQLQRRRLMLALAGRHCEYVLCCKAMVAWLNWRHGRQHKGHALATANLHRSRRLMRRSLQVWRQQVALEQQLQRLLAAEADASSAGAGARLLWQAAPRQQRAHAEAPHRLLQQSPARSTPPGWLQAAAPSPSRDTAAALAYSPQRHVPRASPIRHPARPLPASPQRLLGPGSKASSPARPTMGTVSGAAPRARRPVRPAAAAPAWLKAALGERHVGEVAAVQAAEAAGQQQQQQQQQMGHQGPGDEGSARGTPSQALQQHPSAAATTGPAVVAGPEPGARRALFTAAQLEAGPSKHQQEHPLQHAGMHMAARQQRSAPRCPGFLQGS
jgi:hypothetical protein